MTEGDWKWVGRPSEPNPPLLSSGTAKSNAPTTQSPFACTGGANRAHTRPVHSPQTTVTTEDEQAKILRLKAKVENLRRVRASVIATFRLGFSAHRYTNSSWRQGWRDSSEFNEILHFFFDNILTTTLIPLLRRWLPSLFIHTRTGFVTTSVQSTPLTSPT